MEEPSRKTASFSIICSCCGDAIHVPLSDVRAGEVAACSSCGAERDLGSVELPRGLQVDDLKAGFAGTNPPGSDQPPSESPSGGPAS